MRVPSSFATPRSPILMEPFAAMKMFWDLMSRCSTWQQHAREGEDEGEGEGEGEDGG